MPDEDIRLELRLTIDGKNYAATMTARDPDALLSATFWRHAREAVAKTLDDIEKGEL